MNEVILDRFESPDEIRTFEKGRYSWVVGRDPYVSLHFMGSDHYAKRT